MANQYSGSGGAGPLEVRTFDLATDLFGIDIIEVSNGTLNVGATDNIARITIGGGGGGGTVTSVGLTETGSALVITGSPVTGAGNINIAGAGTNSQVILGDLTLATLPTGTVTGTGAATEVTYWTGATAVAGNADFVFDSINGRVGINVAAPATQLEVRADDDGVAEVRVSRTATQYTEIMNEDAAGGFLTTSSPQSNKKPLRIDAVHNNVGVAANQLYIDLRLGRSVESGGTPSVFLRATEEGLNSEPEVVINESSGSVNFRVETGANTSAFFMDGSADTALFTVPLTSEQNITVGDGTDSDIGLIIDSNTTDYYVGREAATDSFMIGTGTTIGSNSFFTSTTGGAVTMGTSTTTVVGNATMTSGAAGTVVVGGTGTISTTDGGINAGGTGLVNGGAVPGGISSGGHVIWRAEVPVAAGANIDAALGSHFIVDGPVPCQLQPPVIPGETITIWNLNVGGVATLDLSVAAIQNFPAAGLELSDPFSSIQLYNSVIGGGWVIVADSGRITPA